MSARGRNFTIDYSPSVTLILAKKLTFVFQYFIHIAMKNSPRVRFVLLPIVLFGVILFGTTGCDRAQNTEDTKEVAEEHNDAKFDNKDEKDAQFLVNAAEIDLEEIKLGQLAQQNGRMEQVRTLGKMLEEAHLKSLGTLASLAEKKTVTIPTLSTEEVKESYTLLREKSGADFDKKYCELMVNGHKAAIETFEKASTESNDLDIREWANASLPELRRHLDQAIDCQKQCEKME